MKTGGINPESKVAWSCANQHGRRVMLQSMLIRERADAVSRLEVFRREEAEDTPARHGDEMDTARAISETETQARLIDRAHERLRDIEAAIARLAAGSYGVCADCGEDIPMERLAAAPCAVRCVECQQRAYRGGRHGYGGQGRAFGGGAMALGETGGLADPLGAILAAGDRLPIHFDTPFGPEQGELEETVPIRRKRGRPRKIRDNHDHPIR